MIYTPNLIVGNSQSQAHHVADIIKTLTSIDSNIIVCSTDKAFTYRCIEYLNNYYYQVVIVNDIQGVNVIKTADPSMFGKSAVIIQNSSKEVIEAAINTLHDDWLKWLRLPVNIILDTVSTTYDTTAITCVMDYIKKMNFGSYLLIAGIKEGEKIYGKTTIDSIIKATDKMTFVGPQTDEKALGIIIRNIRGLIVAREKSHPIDRLKMKITKKVPDWYGLENDILLKSLPNTTTLICYKINANIIPFFNVGA